MSATCPDCGDTFTRGDNLRRHILTKHGPSASPPPLRKEVLPSVATPPPSSSSEENGRKLEPRRRELEEQGRKVAEKTREVERRLSDADKRERAASAREAELAQREARVEEFEEASSAEVLREEIAQFKAELPSFEEGDIARFGGRDFRVENGSVEHVFFPDGEKHELSEGDLFRVGDTVFWIRSDGGIGGLFADLVAVRLSNGEIAETILEQDTGSTAEEDSTPGEETATPDSSEEGK